MLRKLYEKTMALAHHKRAKTMLAAVSFAESSFFPIPPDVMLIPMILERRDKAMQLAAICTVASVLGGLAGYLIGALLWDTIGQPIIAFYGYEAAFEKFQLGFVEYGGLLVFLFGLTFFPYKVITIASGVVGLNPVVFIAASIAARLPRFFVEALLLKFFGAPIKEFIDKRLVLVTSIVGFLLVGGFVAIKFLV